MWSPTTRRWSAAASRCCSSGEADIEVVGEAGNGAEAVALAASERPDVMLMDVRMPVMDGLEATRRIAGDESLSETRVIILTTFDLDEYVHEALRAGASGFLLKDTLPVDLLNAVRVVADGDALISPKITRRLIEEFARRPEPAAAAAAAAVARTAHRSRARGARARRQGTVERRDRGRAVRQPRHREDPRQPPADEARRPRPRPARDDRLRDRRRVPRRRLIQRLCHGVPRATRKAVTQAIRAIGSCASMPGVLETWTVRARNLPEHADNRIHTDAGARAAGFPAALVAGVTTYAYLTHPIVAAWGLDWVAGGGGEVRFDAPVFDHDDGDVHPGRRRRRCCRRRRGAVTRKSRGRRCAPLRRADRLPPVRDGTPLTSRRVQLGDRWGADYGERVGDDLDLYRREGVIHPAVWPALANHVVAADLVRGPWIHLRSVIRHHGLAPAAAVADVHAVVVDRFQRRSGERAIVDVLIEVDGRPVASLEHEAIIALP